jgi:hypothetical protein
VALDFLPNGGAAGVRKFAVIRVSAGRRIYPDEKTLHQEVMRGLYVYDATWVLCGEAGLEVEALLCYLNSSTTYRLDSDLWRRAACARTTASFWEDAERMLDRFLDLAAGIVS